MSYRRKNKYHYKEEKRTQIVFSNEPLSLSGPTSTDERNERLLENVLREAGRLKEDKLQAQSREYVLQDLDEICQEWVSQSAREHNHPEEFVSNSRVRLFAFGSYKLDVHSLGDDVDLLCVGPNFLTRDMFFDELGIILQENSCINNFYAVRNAYVPVMSFKYNNIDIDMVYAQLQIELLDMEWNINDDGNLKNLDPTSILSLNGVRLAHKTLQLVPNKKVFRLSLRAIRYWAKQRGIYSNKLGYLGGVSWAILIARVCQLYPNANSSQIVQNFYLFYHIWNFGTPLKAITLCNIVQHDDMPSIKLWDPNDQQTKYELMHIITPAFPAMNSTHNVSMSTFEVLKREIARAFHMLSRAQKEINELKWKELFERNTFFIDHKNYIFVKACAPYKNLTEWSGLIESKIRSFVSNLEQHPDVKVTPFCTAIKLKLKQSEINKHTNKEILKEIQIKRQLKIKKQKEKKRKEKLKKIQMQKQKEQNEKLRKEMEEKQKEQMAKLQLQNKIDANKNKNGIHKMDVDNQVENNSNDGTSNSNPIEIECSQDTEKTASLPPNLNENDKTPPLKAEININDGSNKNDIIIKNEIESKSLKSNNSLNSCEDEHGIVIVSNLSLPIETFEPPTSPKSPIINNNNNIQKSSKNKPKVLSQQNNSKSNTPNIINTQQIRPSQPSNPYIYVAPELQRRYTYKNRNRRGQYYGNRRNRFYTNRVYNITSASPSSNGNITPSSTNTNNEKKPSEKDESKKSDSNNKSETKKEESLNNSLQLQSPQIKINNPINSHAFVVGNNQIACCESFNNKILRSKAEKNIGYECRAFVIGLKVVNRVLAIETTSDGQQLEQVTKFDFSRSVVHFLKGLNHIYTDSHIIIELINCNRIPHFLFPQYEYKRPKKDFIKNHQKLMDQSHIKWRSKSCLATINSPKNNAKNINKDINNSPKNVTPKNITPKFDKDDVLMNDDSMDAMPGLGLPPAHAQTKNSEKSVTEIDVNMADNNNNGKSRKRKADSEESMDSMDSIDEPMNKKRKLNGNVNGVAEKLKAEAEPKPEEVIDEQKEEPNSVTILAITEISEPAIIIAKEEDTCNINNIHNRYFEKINWDKKFDNSPTFEYAVNLYKKSQNFNSWSMVSHSVTATATHVYNTCNDQTWKIKLKKVLSNEKYGWNGCKYKVQLNKKLMFDLAHDIAFNYINHKNLKKRKRKS